MKILSEKKKIYYDTEMQFSSKEEADLLSYSHKNMPMEVLNNFYIEWAVVNILRKQMEIDKKKHKKFLKDMSTFAKEQQARNRKVSRNSRRIP